MLPGYPARMEKEPSNEPPRQPPTLLPDRCHLRVLLIVEVIRVDSGGWAADYVWWVQPIDPLDRPGLTLVDCTHPTTPIVGTRPVIILDGGHISSEVGALLLRQIKQRTSIIQPPTRPLKADS
jgi:hypothetical protein